MGITTYTIKPTDAVWKLLTELDDAIGTIFGPNAVLFAEPMEDVAFYDEGLKYVVYINLPPIQVGKRKFYGFAWMFEISDGKIVHNLIEDAFSFNKTDRDRHPHVNGRAMCYQSGDVDRALMDGDYIGAATAVLGKLGTYTPEDAFRATYGVVICSREGCRRYPDKICAECGDNCCDLHYLKCELCRHPYCTNCESFESIRNDRICLKCASDPQLARCQCCENCTEPMWRNASVICGVCSATLHARHALTCRSHSLVFNIPNTFYICHNCQAKEGPRQSCVQCFPEDGKRCAYENCRRGEYKISPTMFNPDARTKDGLSRFCKSCDTIAKAATRAKRDYDLLARTFQEWHTNTVAPAIATPSGVAAEELTGA